MRTCWCCGRNPALVLTDDVPWCAGCFKGDHPSFEDEGQGFYLELTCSKCKVRKTEVVGREEAKKALTEEKLAPCSCGGEDFDREVDRFAAGALTRLLKGTVRSLPPGRPPYTPLGAKEEPQKPHWEKEEPQAAASLRAAKEGADAAGGGV